MNSARRTVRQQRAPVSFRRRQLQERVRSAGVAALLWLSFASGAARGEDRVLLQEVMPELAGSPLGAIDVMAAPGLGTSVTVRKADIQRALQQAGANPRQLQIPRSVRVSREFVNLSREVLADQAHNAVASAAAPCELRDVRYPAEVRLAGGAREFRAEFSSALRTGQLTAAVVVESGGRSVRVPIVATLSCPPPDVTVGALVTARAVVGAVIATAPVEARQPGRAGEIIRVSNRATGTSLRARVIDAQTVEVVP